MPKGGARWEEAIFLTKATTNDMFVVGVGNSIKLTRSIKRIFESWHDKMNLHHEFCVPSWMVEIRGNRFDTRSDEEATYGSCHTSGGWHRG